MPRHGSAGITRSKLEVDECIAVALGENDRASHEEPEGGDGPSGETGHGCLDRDVAQSPMGREEENRDDADLQDFASAEKGVAVRIPAEHAADHAAGGLEIRSAE